MKSYFQVARKYIPDEPTEITPVAEYKRLITFDGGRYPDLTITSLNNNVRLMVYHDEHLAQHALSSGFDVHFQTTGNVELSFELVAYSNGTGVWWVHGAHTFYMLYGDPSRNIDRSTKHIWWDSSSAPYTYLLNAPLVVHTSYDVDTVPTTNGVGNYRPFALQVQSGSQPRRSFNSTFFEGRPSTSPVLMHTSSYPDATPPVHFGYLPDDVNDVYGDAIDEHTNSGRIHLYEHYAAPSGEEPYYYPSASHPNSHIGDQTLIIGAIAQPGHCTQYPYIEGGSPWYTPEIVAVFHDMWVVAQASNIYTYIPGGNINTTVQSVISDGVHDIPWLFVLHQQYNGSYVQQNQTTEYEIWSVDPTSINSLNSLTLSGEIPASDPGVILNTRIASNNMPPALQSLFEQPSGTNAYSTIVHRWECQVVNGNYTLNTYPNTDIKRGCAFFTWYMLFRNEGIRTISDVIDGPSNPSTIPTTLFTWNKSKIYQGLAGGCN